MTVTQIDLDDDESEQAMRNLGAASKKDTVNTALREVNARRRRAVSKEAGGSGVIDLLVAATAVHHDLTILQVDNDFPALTRVLA